MRAKSTIQHIRANNKLGGFIADRSLKSQSQSLQVVAVVGVGMRVMLVVCKHQEWEQQHTAVHLAQHQRGRSSFLGSLETAVAAIRCPSAWVRSQSHLARSLVSRQ
jgi:pheromone shutdown protein TraB